MCFSLGLHPLAPVKTWAADGGANTLYPWDLTKPICGLENKCVALRNARNLGPKVIVSNWSTSPLDRLANAAQQEVVDDLVHDLFKKMSEGKASWFMSFPNIMFSECPLIRPKKKHQIASSHLGTFSSIIPQSSNSSIGPSHVRQVAHRSGTW